MKVEKILAEVNGTTEKKEPKASISVFLDIIRGEDEKNIYEHSALNPTINIKRHGDTLFVDLIFKSSLDADFKRLWLITNEFGDLFDKSNEENYQALFKLLVLPLSLEGKYFILTENPILWTMLPEEPGKEISILRYVFKADDVEFYSSESFDGTKIQAESMRDSDKIQYYENEQKKIDERHENELSYLEKNH